MASEDVTTVDTIRDLKKSDPFSPFQIVMTSGDRYLIEDPDALAIGTSQLFYYPRQKSGAGVHMRLNQIAIVEEAAARRSRNRKQEE